MKIIELFIFLLCLVLSVLWLKNELEYEPAIIFLLGVLSLLDALRRYKIFGKVKAIVSSAKISPYAYRGGKVDSSYVSLEVAIDNTSSHIIHVSNIELNVSDRLFKCLGAPKPSCRTLDVSNNNSGITYPFNISPGESKIIYVERAFNGSEIDKYIQAKNIGLLSETEEIVVSLDFISNKLDKNLSPVTLINTKSFKDAIRAKYEASKDFEGVVYIIEQT